MHPIGGRIVGVVGENLEQVFSQHRFAPGHGGAGIRITDADDDQLGVQDQEETGQALDDRAIVDVVFVEFIHHASSRSSANGAFFLVMKRE